MTICSTSEASATQRWPTTKMLSASTSVKRAESRAVAIVITGAPTIIPTAKTVMKDPTRASDTPRSSAMSGRMPATTNSVVSMRKVPTART